MTDQLALGLDPPAPTTAPAPDPIGPIPPAWTFGNVDRIAPDRPGLRGCLACGVHSGRCAITCESNRAR